MYAEIRKLVPDLLDDYLHFFENVAHEDCYCACYCSDDHTGKDFHLQKARREHAIRYIRNGNIQGYLAYNDNQIIGWCNANNKLDCLKCEGWQMMLSSVNITELTPKIKVKSVFCFTIAPNMRRNGIATQLLERVCKDAAEDGFDYVEAYPNREFIDVFYDHMGPVELYKKCGFIAYEETEQKIVMRKQLK